MGPNKFQILHWTHRTRKSTQPELGTSVKMTPEETQENIRLMNELAGDIIGDLEGILTNIKSTENMHRQQQKELENILIEALKTINLGTLKILNFEWDFIMCKCLHPVSGPAT